MKWIRKIGNIWATIFGRLYFPSKKVFLGKKVRFKKLPDIIITRNANLKIGNNTLINSDNYGYHINMHSRCKLIADKPKAEIKIGDNCRIHGTCIHAFKEITIGDNVLIAANTQIIDANAHELSFPEVINRIHTVDKGKPIHIEDNVWIGANCFILGGVTIGVGSVISANSVVVKSIPPHCVAGGNPAKVIKQY